MGQDLDSRYYNKPIDTVCKATDVAFHNIELSMEYTMYGIDRTGGQPMHHCSGTLSVNMMQCIFLGKENH